jgi:hypothetical protein
MRRCTITGSLTYSAKNAASRSSAAGWMDREPEPCRGLTTAGNACAGSPGSQVGGLGSPSSVSSRCASYLSNVRRHTSAPGTQAGRSLRASSSRSRSVKGTTAHTPWRSTSSVKNGM